MYICYDFKNNHWIFKEDLKNYIVIEEKKYFKNMMDKIKKKLVVIQN